MLVEPGEVLEKLFPDRRPQVLLSRQAPMQIRQVQPIERVHGLVPPTIQQLQNRDIIDQLNARRKSVRSPERHEVKA